MSMGKPMANYAAAKRVGDFVFMSGVVAVDPATRRAVAGYDAIPEEARTALQGVGYATGQMSVDIFAAPIVAQSPTGPWAKIATVSPNWRWACSAPMNPVESMSQA